MIQYYVTTKGKLQETDKYQDNCWIRVTDPTPEELEFLSHQYNVEEDYLTAALDRQETSRVEQDEPDHWALITVNAPYPMQDSDGLLYETIPVGILAGETCVMTVALEPIQELNDFVDGKIKNVFTFLRSRFILQILYHITESFVFYLRAINKKSNEVERKLHSSLDNKQLYEMLDLEKSTVFFSTALNSNSLVVDKLERGRIIKLYAADEDILEDISIEIEQASSMCNIYSNILSGTMDAFASIISNNLNVVMKILTLVTIIMSIPTLIATFYGMNVKCIPFPNFWIVVGISAVATLIGFLIFYKLNMFK